jgi:hypothetical protein
LTILTLHWRQATRAPVQLKSTDLGIIQGGAVGLRRRGDKKSTQRELFYGVPPDSPYLGAAKERYASELSAASLKAHAWKRQIESLVSTGPRSSLHPLPLYGIKSPSDSLLLRHGGVERVGVVGDQGDGITAARAVAALRQPEPDHHPSRERADPIAWQGSGRGI